jgi:hypothetical protein
MCSTCGWPVSYLYLTLLLPFGHVIVRDRPVTIGVESKGWTIEGLFAGEIFSVNTRCKVSISASGNRNAECEIETTTARWGSLDTKRERVRLLVRPDLRSFFKVDLDSGAVSISQCECMFQVMDHAAKQRSWWRRELEPIDHTKSIKILGFDAPTGNLKWTITSVKEGEPPSTQFEVPR